MRQLFLIAAFLTVRISLAADPILNPKLVFDPDQMSQLENCIMTSILQSSPDQLTDISPAGNIGWYKDSSGIVFKSIAEELAVGITPQGKAVTYSLRFVTRDPNHWEYFQSGSEIGVAASNMDSYVDVVNHKSGQKVLVANIASCR